MRGLRIMLTPAVVVMVGVLERAVDLVLAAGPECRAGRRRPRSRLAHGVYSAITYRRPLERVYA